MPYSSNADLPKSIKNALPVAAQTIYRKAFNSAYESYDGDEEKTIATAWTAIKTKYEKKNTKWVLKKKVESKVVSGGIDFNRDAAADEWIPVAKVGQEALLSPDNRIVKYGKDGLISYANSQNALGVTYNHGLDRILEHAQIDKFKFEEPYLYMQIPEQVRTAMKDPRVSGCSIEGIPQKIEDNVIEAVEGTYLSLMEYPQMPACRLEEGCGVVSSSVLEQAEITTTADTNTDITVKSQEALAVQDATKAFDTYVINNAGIIVKIGHDTVYGTKKQLKDEEYIKMELMQRGSYYGRDNLQFYESDNAIKLGDVLPSKSLPVHTMTVVISKEAQELMESDNENIKQSSRGGDVEGMEKEEPITYSDDQVKQMVASAVGEVETNLKNQQEVNINELKKEDIKTKEELEAKHVTELKEAAELAYKKAETITAFKAKFNPSEEVLKQAEELDPIAIEFFVGLNIPMQESASGVTSGAALDPEDKTSLADVKARYDQKLGRGIKVKE